MPAAQAMQSAWAPGRPRRGAGLLAGRPMGLNAIASADSEEAGQAGRRGHGASGHARMLDYLSIDTDGGLTEIPGSLFFVTPLCFLPRIDVV